MANYLESVVKTKAGLSKIFKFPHSRLANQYVLLILISSYQVPVVRPIDYQYYVVMGVVLVGLAAVAKIALQNILFVLQNRKTWMVLTLVNQQHFIC